MIAALFAAALVLIVLIGYWLHELRRVTVNINRLQADITEFLDEIQSFIREQDKRYLD